jgi:hypothetical protein
MIEAIKTLWALTKKIKDEDKNNNKQWLSQIILIIKIRKRRRRRINAFTYASSSKLNTINCTSRSLPCSICELLGAHEHEWDQIKKNWIKIEIRKHVS